MTAPVDLFAEVRRLRAALRTVANWRAEARAHDEDMGDPVRDFTDDDWDLVERHAKQALENE